MLVYHMDCSSFLRPGTFTVGETPPAFARACGLYLSSCVRSQFPGGVSMFGVSILAPSFDQAKLRQQTIELCLDRVRLGSFPHLPSRLQSFFAVSDPEYLLPWYARFRIAPSKLRVWECEVPAAYVADARCLDLVRNDFWSLPTRVRAKLPGAKKGLLFPASCIPAALEYWKSFRYTTAPTSLYAVPSAGTSSPPLQELLIQGKVRVLRRVPIP